MSAAASPAAAFGLALAGGHWHLSLECGSRISVPFERFIGEATAADGRLLERARGPVLDVGCGPGRHVHHLARNGVLAVGIDVSRDAIALARRRGAKVLLRSVFDDVPGAGTWGTVLLIDGNIGIGGDPTRLLRRVSTLLAPGAEILVECTLATTAPGAASVRLVGQGITSAPFPWALVTAEELGRVAADAGLTVTAQWTDETRDFAVLVAR